MRQDAGRANVGPRLKRAEAQVRDDSDALTTIAKEESSDRLTLVQSLTTEKGARTIALDPKTHRIFLPTAQFGPPPTPSPGASPGRPTILPNSLKLLIYGSTEKPRQ